MPRKKRSSAFDLDRVNKRAVEIEKREKKRFAREKRRAKKRAEEEAKRERRWQRRDKRLARAINQGGGNRTARRRPGQGVDAEGCAQVIAFIFFRRKYHEQMLRLEAEKQQRYEAISDLQQLAPEEFEEFVEAIFKKWGYRTILRGGVTASDRGVDIEARKDDDYVIVQCKRHAADNKVGSKDIRAFIGAFYNSGANQGVFVTTSSFTEPARREVKGHPIKLVDQPGIIAWQKELKIGPYREQVVPGEATRPPPPNLQSEKKMSDWVFQQPVSPQPRPQQQVLPQQVIKKQGMAAWQVMILVGLTIIATVIFVCLALAVLGSLIGPPPG